MTFNFFLEASGLFDNMHIVLQCSEDNTIHAHKNAKLPVAKFCNCSPSAKHQSMKWASQVHFPQVRRKLSLRES